MRSTRLPGLLALSFLAFSIGSPAQTFQQWSEVDLTGSWGRFDFVVPLLARTDADLPNPQLAATGLTVDLRLHPHLILTGGYLFATLPQRSQQVHLPLVALTPVFQVRRLVVMDRNRIEQILAYPGNPVRYRHRVLADLSLDRGWHLFSSDEILFNLSAGEWNQNRFQVGGGRQLSSRLSLDLYYLQRNAAHGAPTVHALETTLRIALHPRRS